jgi:hypothetical protein
VRYRMCGSEAAVHWLWARAELEPKYPIFASFPGCCARPARRHRGSAEKRDELAPPQLIGPHVPPRFEDRTTSYPKWRIAVRGVCGLLCSASGDPRNGRLWHDSEALGCANRFR